MKGQEEFRAEVNKRFDEVDDRFDALEHRLDAIEKQTNEETTLALKALLKKQVDSLVAHIERTTGENVKMQN